MTASLARMMAGADVSEDAPRRDYDAYLSVDADITRALLRSPAAPYLPSTLWEPACGDGHMARTLQADGRRVIASDIRRTGFGFGGIDFLAADPAAEAGIDPAAVGVVTNPPFTLYFDRASGQQVPGPVKGQTRSVNGISAFVQRASALGVPVVALLHKGTAWHTGAMGLISQQTGYKAAFVLPLGWRPDWTGGRAPTMDVAWTVWMHPDRAPAWPHPALIRLPRPDRGR